MEPTKNTSLKMRSPYGSDVLSDAGTPHHNEKRNYAEVSNCSSRDILCCLIFSVLTVFSILLSIYFLNWGDPDRLTRGWDFRGEICGVSHLEDLKYTYFPDPKTSVDIRLCMAGCPALNTTNTICFYDTDSEKIADFTCYNSYAAKPYYNRYCLPSNEDEREEVVEFLDKGMIRLAWWAGDVGRTWDVLGAGALISLGVVLIVICWISIGTFVKSLAAVTTFVLVGFTVILGYLMYKEGFRLQDDLCDDFDPVEMLDCDYDAATKAHIVLSSFIYLGGLIMGLVYVTHIKHITRGSVIVRQSWRPIAKNWTIVLVPVFLTILSTGVSVLCLYSTVYGLSVADVDTVDVDSVPGGKVKTLDFDRYEKILLVYMIVNYIWLINFLSQICYYVAAFTQIQWHFNKLESTCYMLNGLKHAISSMGSIALGSFLIPIVQFIKVIFPCYFLLPRVNVLRSVTHSSYTLQILTGLNFFKSGVKARKLLDSANLESRKAILGSRLLHWITSMLVIIIAPLYVAYWLHYQDKTPTGYEETNKVTSISVMCATVIFPAWTIARIWYMFFHGLSNSAVIVNIYDSRTSAKVDKQLEESVEAKSDKVSSSFTNDLDKQDDESLSKKTDLNHERNGMMVDGNQSTFIHQEGFADSMIDEEGLRRYVSLAGVVRPISQSGRPFQDQNQSDYMNQDLDSFIEQEGTSVIAEAQNEGSDISGISYLKKKDSAGIVQGDFVHSETKKLTQMRENLEQRELALMSEVSALEGVQSGYREGEDSVYQNQRMMAADPEDIRRAEDVINSLEKDSIIDLEGDYENPTAVQDAPHLLNPSNSKDQLNLLY